MQVEDFEAVLDLLAPGVVRNPRLAQVVIKCALYAVRDESGKTTPIATDAVAQLRARLLGTGG